jgi:dihydrodipicolinate synthase/N-acetylneuraminate lyase
MGSASIDELIAHCTEVARVIPLMGFYLQPAVGGRVLPYAFWRRFAEIANVVAIKIAPFNRYQTLDVVRAVAESGRAGEIALYTGNDDCIVADLVTSHAVRTSSGVIFVPIVGGLLGHWACWTRGAVGILSKCRAAREAHSIPTCLLTLGAAITDCNAAFFDAANSYQGALPGISAVLERQGLLANHLCLDPGATLSPGQPAEIDRVTKAYPHLADDSFVAENVSAWLD